MIRTRSIAALLAALLLARPAAAQTPGDTTTLVRAVADHLGAWFKPAPPAQPRHRYLGEPTTDFDRWVTHSLRDALGLPLLEERADTAVWVVTRGALFRGDTAEVRIELGDRARPRDGIETGIETWRYIFVRRPAGWELVRRAHVSTMHIGHVRGER